MKGFFLNVAAGLMTAAIVANVAVLWNFNARLARIETLLSSHPAKHVAEHKP